MRKIKSVKLLNDYRDRTHYILAGTKLANNGGLFWWLANIMAIDENEIREDKTNLFDVEYEPERKSIMVKIEYDSINGNNDFTAQNISYILNLYSDLNHKVTEVTND